MNVAYFSMPGAWEWIILMLIGLMIFAPAVIVLVVVLLVRRR